MSRTGRKGKYHDWLTKDGLTKLEGWARDGLTDEQIAKNIGIATGTIYTWKKKYREIDEALKRGKEVIDFEVENALLKRALGYEYEEVKIVQEKGPDGKDKLRQEKVIKQVAPDTTAQIFWLKNRKPDTWMRKGSLDTAKTEAQTAFMEERTKLLQGAEKDTSLLEALIDTVKDDE